MSFSLTIILLPTKQLLNIYVLFTIFTTLFFSFLVNSSLLQQLLHPDEPSKDPLLFQSFWLMLNRWASIDHHSSNMVGLLMLQGLVARFYCHLKGSFLNNNIVYSVIPIKSSRFKIFMLLLMPFMFTPFFLNEKLMNFLSLVSLIFILIDMKEIFEVLSITFFAFKLSLPARVMVIMRDNDVIDFFESQWTRVHTTLLFRIFFLLQNMYTISLYSTFSADPIFFELDNGVIDAVLERNTCTFISIICLTSVLYFIAHHTGRLCTWLIDTDREEDQHLGKMVAVLFILLAVQTGLPILHPSKRINRLFYNLSLTLLASMHYVHLMLHFKLQSLALTIFSRLHIKQLFFNAVLFCSAGCFVIYNWIGNPLSTWLLSLFAFGCELLVKICISIALYLFVFIDSQTGLFSDKSDDIIYYLKLSGKLIEFLFGIFLFGNGVWMVLFESAGLLRVVIMLAHLYFNIWKEAKQLYTTCTRRREASIKVSSLETANTETLNKVNDVCSICFQSLHEGVVKETRCGHFFHENCFCRWINVSDTCPLCTAWPFHFSPQISKT